jgi:hypothetical protein
MADFTSSIRALVAEGDLLRALDALAAKLSASDLRDEASVLRASLARLEKEERRGLLSSGEAEIRRSRLSFSVLELLAAGEKSLPPEPAAAIALAPSTPEPTPAPTPPPRRSVFLSYSHADRSIALQVKSALEKHGFAPRIDLETFTAGENLTQAIERTIRQSDVTLSLVSSQSLLSAWVLVESIHTFHAEKLTGKKFLAGYLDEAFFAPGFRLTATKQIDARIAELEQLAGQYAAERLDTNDLNEEKSRLYNLRNQLGTVLTRLKESVSVDLRAGQFEAGLERLAAEIAA